VIGLCVPRVFAQDETDVEIITEPPPLEEPPPPVEPTPEPTPEPSPPPPAPPKEKLGHLRVGGGIGFGFSTGFISVGVAPQVSYIFKRIVEPGVSIRYQYARDRVVVPEVTWHTVGASIFTRIFPVKQLFFLIEGEVINTGPQVGGIKADRQTYGNLLLGGGLIMGVGKGAFVATSLKIAVFRNPFYPDVFPIISVGAGYAF
jgi:hypothetical protein